MCSKCDGQKKIAQTRCPDNTMSVKNFPEFKYYVMLKEYNTFPSDGGIANQSSYFLKVIELCDRVTGLCALLDDEQKERLAAMKAGKDGKKTGKYV